MHFSCFLLLYMLIKTEYTVIFKFKNVSTTVFLKFTTLHAYNSYLQVELFIATIFYYDFYYYYYYYCYFYYNIITLLYICICLSNISKINLQNITLLFETRRCRGILLRVWRQVIVSKLSTIIFMIFWVSLTMHDYYLQTWYIRDASRVVERRKT